MQFDLTDEARVAVKKWADAKENNQRILPEAEESIHQKSDTEPIIPDMLPPSIRLWIEDVCERIEAPFGIGAIGAICLLGNLIGSGIGIRPKQKDTWTVVPNLWGMIIGAPSIKKTPVYIELFKSIGRLQKKAEDDFSKELKLFTIVNELHSKQLAEAIRENNTKAIEALKVGVPIKPRKRRYITQDGTIEAITDIIRENPNGLLVSRDELSGWLKQMERSGREGERAFYLEAWNGIGSFSVDRIARGSIFLPRLTVGVIGNIQSSTIKEYVYEAVKNKKADGFLQRFQMTIYAEPIEQQLIDRYPNETARKSFDDVIDYVTSGKGFKGAVYDDSSDIPFYHFDEEAQNIFNKWYLANAKEATNAINEALEGHLSKYPKLFTSLALIFHICDIAGGRSFDYSKIDKCNAQRALELTIALKSHANKLYATFEIEEDTKEMITDKILLFLSRVELPYKFRDATHKIKGKPNKETILDAIKGRYEYAGGSITHRIK
jgi:hypothetical protein